MAHNAKYPDTAWGRIRAYLDNATTVLSRVDLGELLAENVQLKRRLEWPDEQPQDAPLTVAELAELTASIEHLSGPDAWDENRLEPALIPVTHYVPRLLAMVAQGQPQGERDGDDSAAARVRATLDRHAARGSIGGEYLDDDVRAVLDNREQWRNLALSRGRERDGDVRAVERARDLIEALWNGDAVTADAEHVLAELAARFAPAIAALDARDEHAASQDRVDDGFAWHELHYGLGPDPLGPEPESRYYQLFHAEQCLTLPTGAACWADHEPHRHWWPAEDGEYRIRPVEMFGGGTEDGPNEPTLTMEIQVRAGEEWVDYNGPCVGDLEARDAGDGR